MNYSSTYLLLEEMIRKSWVTDDLTEFDRVLDHYEEQGRITAEEQQALMELYIQNASRQPN